MTIEAGASPPQPPRVLHVHRRLLPNGGGQAVAAWTLQALKDCCNVTLLTLLEPDFAGLNRSYGTDLRKSEVEVIRPSAFNRALVRALPTPGEQLVLSMLMLQAREILRQECFDAVIGTDNEADFGQVGIQYVHYPWHRPPLPDELRPIHRVPGLLAAYRWITGPVMGVSLDRLRGNQTLANSGFIAKKVHQVHGIQSRVVHPPVPGGFPETPWKERKVGFVGIGRFHPIKRWRAAVNVLRRVRARGQDASLAIIGMPDSIEESEWLRSAARKHDWISLHIDVPRNEMVRIVANHRYGIHPMEEEHFGIAVAELLRAGCIPFVHDSGGPPEIVGGHPELLFETDDDAVGKISSVLDSGALQQRLLRRLADRREAFSEERFMSAIRREVGVIAGADLG